MASGGPVPRTLESRQKESKGEAEPLLTQDHEDKWADAFPYKKSRLREIAWEEIIK